jgi:phosphatidylinositol-3-phosphatase
VSEAPQLWAARLARLIIAFALAAVALQTASASAAARGVPAFDHIFIIVMENHSYAEIIGNTGRAPYLNHLAKQYGVATNYHAITHPSLPNYLALTGGDTFHITSDCNTCWVNAPDIAVNRVAASGRTWKAYMDSMPSRCLVGDAYPYAQRHDPFIYFTNVRTSPGCPNHVVPLSMLRNDLARTVTTPNYVWISPNLCHDMHDCSISAGDTWLRNTLPEILRSPAFITQKSLVLITWDEDDSSANNHVATLVIARGIPPGFRSATAYNHYSLLRTIEQAWGLAPLGNNDRRARPMSDFFEARHILNPVQDTFIASAP